MLASKASILAPRWRDARNMVFVARKRVHWWQMPTHSLGFMISDIGLYTALGSA
jgi:hypothetical protein